jgi:hypothetical protein
LVHFVPDRSNELWRVFKLSSERARLGRSNLQTAKPLELSETGRRKPVSAAEDGRAPAFEKHAPAQFELLADGGDD